MSPAKLFWISFTIVSHSKVILCQKSSQSPRSSTTILGHMSNSLCDSSVNLVQPTHQRLGKRVEFIYAIPPERGLKSSDCAVSVDTVRNGGAAPDNMYYLENQFKKPMFRIFDLMMDNALDIFKVNGRKKQVIQSSGGIGKFLKIKRKPENPQEDTENPQEAQHNSKKRKTIVMKRNRKKQSMLASYFKK